jgi:hypothetical protein
MKLADLKEAKYYRPDYVGLVYELINTPFEPLYNSEKGVDVPRDFHRKDFPRSEYDVIYKQFIEEWGEPETVGEWMSGVKMNEWFTHTPGHKVSSSWRIVLNAWGDQTAIEVSRT